MPPYTKIAGRFKRDMAIMQPGIFLSQPPIATIPSKTLAADYGFNRNRQSLRGIQANIHAFGTHDMPSDMVMV